MARSSWIGAVAGGIVAGAISSLVVARYAASDKQTERSRADLAPAGVLKPVAAERAKNPLEQRVRVLEHLASETKNTEEAPPPAASARPIPAPASREVIEQGFARKLENQRAEPIDPTWAPKAARSLEQDLRALEQAVDGRTPVKGKLLGVSCATSTCRADFEWSDFETARGEWREFMHASYELGCAREIVLPEPQGTAKGQSYRASMLYECENARTDQVALSNQEN
jgi:hypothetical protein